MPLTRPKLHQIVTTTFEVNDPLLEINKSETGANTNDLGILINRGTSGNNVGIIWDRSEQSFVLAETTADGDTTGDLFLSSYSDLKVKDIAANSIAVDTGITINGSEVLVQGVNVDASTLGTLSASQFLRSDDNDTTTGTLTVSGGTLTVTGSSARLKTSSGDDTTTGVNIANSVGGVGLLALSTSGNFVITQTTSAGVFEDSWIVCNRNGSVDLRYND